MSEPEDNAIHPEDQPIDTLEPEVALAAEHESAEAPSSQRPRRRRLIGTLLGLLLLVCAAIAIFCLWMNSAACADLVRRSLITRLEAASGARVELADFQWRPFSLTAEAGGLVLHGKEAATEEPYLRVDRLNLQLSLLNLFSPRVLLRSLTVEHPQFHLIVYSDGSTNQPQPRKQKKAGKSALETLFDLKAGRIAITNAAFFYENRAAAFDFQNRFAPLSLRAEDFALQLAAVDPQPGQPESFHVETGARNLQMTRGPAAKPGLEHGSLPVEGYLQASLDLTRSAAYLRSLRITARGHKVPDRTLQIVGSLENFSRPRWQAKTTGELDLRLLESLTGYNFAPEGLAHLDLLSAGEAGLFRIDGSVHISDGAYVGTGVVARGIQLDTHVHADAEELLVQHIVARLRPGGEIDGDLDLKHWLPPTPGIATLQPATNSKHNGHAPPKPIKPINPADVIEIPVDGKVVANFKDVALDTILAMVCDPPFQHLGLDTRVNGPANAVWFKGDKDNLTVQALLNLVAPKQTAPGTVPTQGLVDATYYQHDGSVDMRKFDLHTPQSQIQSHGHLGAYPLISPTVISVDMQTANLGEFDTVLRDLGLTRAGKSGVAALPVALAGQAEFHGSWSGSLIDPRLAGQLKATQVGVELASAPAQIPAKPAPPKSLLPRLFSGAAEPKASAAAQAAQAPQVVKIDSIEATGSYSAAQIKIDHAQFHQRQSTMDLDGSLTAMTTLNHEPVFDENAVAHAHLRATQISLDQIQPFLRQQLPVIGQLDAQLSADGPLRTLAGSGWVELDKAKVYGEPVARIRAQGSFAGKSIQLSSLSIADLAGKIAASGSIDLGNQSFQMETSSSGLDLSRIDSLRSQGLAVTGKLGFKFSGSGTFDDPSVEGRAVLTDLALSGEPLGTVQFSAHTANRAILYDLSTRLDAAELTAHGQTALQGDHPTQARVDFSRFNIGALLKMAHLPGLSGTSELAGAITLDGPLSRPEAMRGEARLQELAVEISGVHLHSDGEVHATLANGRLSLDPLHITGESTDMSLQGTLSLLEKDKRQLDIVSSGAINLSLAHSFDPDLTASGTSTFDLSAHGPLLKPDLRGRVDFQNGSLALEDLPNGLSQIHGALEFNQNRLEVKSLTAQTGGGQLSLGGYLAYQNGLYANLTATGKGVRIRYPQGVSSLADASLHLQGTQNNLILGGDVLITRFAISPDFDFTALATQASGVQTFAPPEAPSNHIRLDVHFTSSPQLNFQNAYAKLAGDVDLRLRGTVASPSLLGRVSITQGSAILAGTRYDLQRGELNFTNPVRIQPTLDLNATAHVEDFDITLGLHGPIDHPTVNYRSDPPLPEADVVALLALGRTQSQQRIFTQQQIQSNPTDALLAGALNANVSSRVQKLFGAGSVKVDPNYLGAMGNSTSRIIVEEQLGRNLTLTYATNVNTTGQQLLQADVAINHHISLQVARDESGVFSMVLKATRRYR